MTDVSDMTNTNMTDMPEKEGRRFGLSGTTLKLLAAFSMLLDHIGVILLPDMIWLRIAGRLAFPFYAFMIAEGCAHTRHQRRYFLTVFALGVACQAVYYLYDGSTDMGILITFSLSILVIYAMQYAKKTVRDAACRPVRRWMAFLALATLLVGVYLLDRLWDIDYGFIGCMTPVLASLFRDPHPEPRTRGQGGDRPIVHVLMLGIGLVILACGSNVIQWFSLAAIPLLLLYSGQRGAHSLKYFFYIFYPAHLAILGGLSMILR